MSPDLTPQEMGRRGGSQPKHYSEAELARRRQILAEARAKRWPRRRRRASPTPKTPPKA